MRFSELYESDHGMTHKSVKDVTNDIYSKKRPYSSFGDHVDLESLNLTSLAGCPDVLECGMDVSNNKLVSLNGSPTHVKGKFEATHNELTSLVGGPKIVDGMFNVSDNPLLVSLAGSPDYIDDMFSCARAAITSVDGLSHTIDGYVYLTDCQYLHSLQDIHQSLRIMNGKLVITGTPIVSHILGVFLIKGCKGILSYDVTPSLRKAIDIVNNYISKGRAGLMGCQAELIEAGLDDFAQI